MYTLKFILKQHTPLIHFQHDQEGATLRASEVKPKLDRFVIEKLGGFEYVKTQHPSWMVGKKDHPALDYKMRIVPFQKNESLTDIINVSISQKDGEEKIKIQNLPTFFGNMMKLNEFKENIKEPKKISLYKSCTIFLSTNHDILFEKINLYFSEFIFINNFGTRQTKGFGSFYLDESEKAFMNPKSIINYLYFDVDTLNDLKKDIENCFNCIDLYYRTIRGGINLKNRDTTDKLYFKSLLFLYAKSLNQQWDKRTIRHSLFLYHPKYSNKQNSGILQERKEANGTVQYNSALKETQEFFYDFRDLLGLSSEQDWRYYGDKIIKIVSKDDEKIDRFKSPILFKPIKVKIDNRLKWRIYIIPNDIDKFYLGAIVKVSKNDGSHVDIKIPENFDLNHYLKFSINNYSDSLYDNPNDTDPNEKVILDNIYSQLKKQIK